VDTIDAIARKVAKKANKKRNTMRLFDQQDDRYIMTIKNVMCFKRLFDQQDDRYIMTIKNVMCFKLTMDHISIGMSFRQTTIAIQHAKDHTNTTKLIGMNDLIVG
jgi:hypothetical protein